MNVTLLALNSRYVHSALSVWAVSAAISEYSAIPHNVRVLELTIHNDIGDITSQLEAQSPDIIGISACIWNASMLPELLSKLRERLPGVLIALGGPEAANNIAYWQNLGADYVLKDACGFAALLDKLQGTQPVTLRSDLDGRCHKSKINSALVATAEVTQELSYWPDPYSDEFLKSIEGRIAYIETSRGCPFSCAFCLSAGESVRFLPEDIAIKRIDKLASANAKIIKFVDRTFNCNPDFANKIFEHVIKLDTTATFHFEVAPDLFDGKTLALLAKSPLGRIQLEAGIQSFHPSTLAAISRRSNLEKAERNLKAILENQNIHLHIDLIAGLPEEDLSTFKNSFDRAYKIGAHNLQLGTLKLLHGSILRRNAEEIGIIYNESPPYEVVSTPWLSKSDLSIIKAAENALRNTVNKGRFRAAFDYVLTETEMRPFELFHTIGNLARHCKTPLDVYCEEIYEISRNLPNIDEDVLISKFKADWPTHIRGKNTPKFLKNIQRGFTTRRI